jgi:DNA-binding FrmR family transcriptional regulator
MAHVTTSKEKIVARVRRIAGQVAAIERSVTADADCAETLHLVAAVRGAVAGLMDELVEDHLHAHVAAPIWATPSGPPPPPSWPSCFAAISAEFPSRDPMLPKDPTVTAHSHDYLGHAHDENARRTRAVVWLSAGMMVAEIVAGYLTGSMALLADGFHMATHVGALGSPRSPIPMPEACRQSPLQLGHGQGRRTGGVRIGHGAGHRVAGHRLWIRRPARRSASGRVSRCHIGRGAGPGVNLISAWMLAGGHGHDHGHAQPWA